MTADTADGSRYRFAAADLRAVAFLRGAARFDGASRAGAFPLTGLPASIHACTRSSLIRRAFGNEAHVRNASFCPASRPENSVLPFGAPDRPVAVDFDPRRAR